jgi:hypothetical protein
MLDSLYQGVDDSGNSDTASLYSQSEPAIRGINLNNGIDLDRSNGIYECGSSKKKSAWFWRCVSRLRDAGFALL